MKRFIIIVVLIAAIGAGVYYFRNYQLGQQRAQALASLQIQQATRGALTAVVGATGVVRSNQSAIIVWQTSGSVERVNVTLGSQVETDQVLANIKETTLAQNIILAKAELVNSRKALDTLLDTDLQTAQALQAVENAENALEDLDDTDLQVVLAEKAILDAERALDQAERRLTSLQTSADQASIDAAQAQVVLAQDVLNRARDNFAPHEDKPETDLVRATLQGQLYTAQQSYDSAVRRLNALRGTANAFEVSVGEADVATARVNLEQAQRNLERVQEGPSEATVALLEAQLKDARERYERLLSGVDFDDIAAAEARISANEATIALQFIAAPFYGIISEILVKPGDQVSPGTRAFRIDDFSRLLVDVDVSEVDINRIKVGQLVNLNFDAILDRTYQGQVVEVALVGTTVQGVVSFRVTVELLNPDESVRPGMTAGVNILVSELEDVLLVPNRAVRIRDGQRVVYLFRDGDVAPSPVVIELGASSDVFSEVVSGSLREGDPIVLNPPTDLTAFFGPPR